jgi:SAM-dependent methyltransferase
MEDFSELTRRIYHEQHKRIAADGSAMRRFIAMFSEAYFGFDDGFFVGKSVLDAGCGDTAKLLIALYRLGCRNLCGCDLGADFIAVAKQSLVTQGVPEDGVKFSSSSVCSLNYESEAFDFTSCHGVLLHLNSLDEVRQAFGELARVTRRGGHLYTVFGVVGGLLEDCIIPAVREYYRNNDRFRKYIDAISPDHFAHFVDIIENGILQHEGKKEDLEWLRGALDTDLAVTIQNIVQAPVRLRVDEGMIREMYSMAGFEEPRRLKRYVRRQNIRRYVAPLHYAHQDEFVSLVYGTGNLEFIARKV